MKRLTPVFAETYLSDLRSNRPQRPSGARPLSTASKSRWAPQTSVSLMDAAPSVIEPRLHPSPPRPGPSLKSASSPKTTDDINRRESWLLRRASHKRSNTFSAPSITSSISPSLRSGTPTPAPSSTPTPTPAPAPTPVPAAEEKEIGWDGKDLQEGRMGDTPPKKRQSLEKGDTPPKRSNSLKKQTSFSFRDLSKFAVRHERSGSSSSTSTSSSTSSTITKKTVSWALPSLSRPNSPPPVVMPPTHPPPKSAVPQIEEELTSHFRSLPPAPLPIVAPLRINKTPIGGRPVSRSVPRESLDKLPIVPEASPTYPVRKESSVRTAPIFSSPGRRAYIDPHKKEPTQHNKVRYTTNPVPLPSPPMSGSEEEDAEAEALKELGRRPLPKVGNSSGNGSASASGSGSGGPSVGRTSQEAENLRRNRPKYGAQVQPPPPPVIGLVTLPTPPQTASSVTAAGKIPSIPTISLPDEDEGPRIPVPAINLPDDDFSKDKKPAPSIPSISFQGESPSSKLREMPRDIPRDTQRRPLPTPRANAKPPSSNYSSGGSTSGGSSSGGYVNSRGPTASCSYCRTPIEGRVVSASSIRFHPECFRCDHCHTRLEHVGFFPEPEESRKKRLEAGGAEADRGGKIRFYCHLDFHELFSPRCRSCKTPIEGEVVVACGGTWHAGHFFCAECGDPFNSESRFVEKDGYAWCVGCYQKRYSGKCKKCKKPVTETVVKALGGEWHEECFCCTVSLLLLGVLLNDAN